MRDDTVIVEEEDAAQASKPGRVGSTLARMELGRFISIRWWWRWFNKSLIQTGRLTTLLMLIGLIWIRNEDPELLRLIRAKTFDTYQQIKPRPFMGADSQVIIIDLDEGSLDEFGQWPWPRTRWAQVVEKLTELGASAVAFDILFTDTDSTSVAGLADKIPGITPEMRQILEAVPANDDLFADAIKANGKVVMGHTPASVQRADAGYTRSSIRGQLGADPKPFLEDHPFILRNLEVLDRAAAGRGVFSVAEDRIDGIVRRISMMVASPNGIFPALSLESIRVHLGARNVIVETDEFDGLQRVILQKNDQLEKTSSFQSTAMPASGSITRRTVSIETSTFRLEMCSGTVLINPESKAKLLLSEHPLRVCSMFAQRLLILFCQALRCMQT